VAVAACLPLLAVAPTLPLFAAAFLVFGAVTSALDLAMNAHAVAVEERYARPIFSSFHASWSLGGLAGAGAGGGAAALGAPPLAQFAAVAAVVAAIAAWTRRGLLPRAADARPGGPSFGRPSPALLGLAALAFAGLLAEGAAADWSAVYLHESVGTGEGTAAAGFAAFAAMMTLGRLVGDRLTAAWGSVVLTRAAGILATTGMALALGVGGTVPASSASPASAPASRRSSPQCSVPPARERLRRERGSRRSRRWATLRSSSARPGSASSPRRRACGWRSARSSG
jgi:hypothetical protein